MIIRMSFTYRPKRKRKKAKVNVARRMTPEQKREIEKVKLTPTPVYKRQDRSIPSLKTTTYNTFKTEIPQYTGDRGLIGYSTLHKSNMIPVFTGQEEHLVEHANMRRNT